MQGPVVRVVRHKLEGTLAADEHPVRRAAYYQLSAHFYEETALCTRLYRSTLETSYVFTIYVRFSQGRKHIGGGKTDLWRKKGRLGKTFSSLTTLSEAAALSAFIAIAQSLSTCSARGYTWESLPYKKIFARGLAL